jgi:preprotein translocase subunit SecD
MGKQSRLLAVILAIVLASIYWIATHPPRLGLDLRGGALITLEAETNPKRGINEITPNILEAAKYVVEQRINGLGVSEASVQASGKDRLLVQLPGVDNTRQAKEVIGTTAQLEFRQQKQGTEVEFRLRLQERENLTLQQSVVSSLDKDAIAKQRAELEKTGDKEALTKFDEDVKKRNEASAKITAEVKKNRENIENLFALTELTGERLRDAFATPTDQTQTTWDVSLQFDDRGGELFAKMTGELGGTGRSIGIFLDDKLISYPIVPVEFQGKGITGGGGRIEMRTTIQEATTLSLQLRAGALPVPVKIVENYTVGATLGADSVQSSIYAGMGGLILVLVFMVVYYRVPGMVADIALIVYSIITFALFSLLGVTLTLPGIAGYILSIGIAVDANVLIFERTREELLAGRTLYKSVEAGFNRAWASILDSNVTTLISCAALFWLGSGLVKGFAVTLAVGVAVSMFTAITCSRALLLAVISNPDFRKPELYGVKAFGKPTGQPQNKSTDITDKNDETKGVAP